VEFFGAFLYNAAAFVVILSIIVFIHEFGHYYIAKISGVKIETFSIGFGKEIFGWNDKSGTRWRVSLIPMGGYVKMFGDSDPASTPDGEKIKTFTEEEKKIAFHTKPLGIKAAIVAAGPAANFLLAVVILAFFFSYYGKPSTLAVADQIMAESAAEEAGLKPGDLILTIENEKIQTFSDLQRVIALNTGTPVTLEVQREDKTLTLSVTPRVTLTKDVFGNEVKAARLGVISTTFSSEKIPLHRAPVEAVVETYRISASTLKAIWQMLTGQRDASDITGPIGIAKYSGQSAERGMSAVLWFMVVISINLGLINLFPVPLLDGGHLLYYALEGLRGKPVTERFQQYGFKIGLTLVVALALFSITNDIRKLDYFKAKSDDATVSAPKANDVP